MPNDKTADSSTRLLKKLDEMRLPTMRPADQEVQDDAGAKPADNSTAGLGGAQGKPVLRPADKPIKDDMAQQETGVAQPDQSYSGQGAQDSVDPTYYDNEKMYNDNFRSESIEQFAGDSDFDLLESISEKDTELRASFKKSVNESFNTLLEGSDDLSDEFKEGTKVIFEAAVDERMESLKEAFATECTKEFNRARKEMSKRLMEEVDRYTSYVAEEWVSENQLTIETSLRSLVAESFMEDMKGLFEKHHVSIPESKVDLVERALNTIDSLEEQLSESLKKTVALSEKVKKFERQAIVESCLTGLTKAQAEKVKTLSEGLEFGTVEGFKKKIQTLAESTSKSETKQSAGNLFEDVTGPVIKTSKEGTLNEEVDPDVAALLVKMKKRA